MGAWIVKRASPGDQRTGCWRTARGATGIRCSSRAGPGPLGQFRHPSFHVLDRPINVAVVADNQGIRRQRYWKLADAIQELTNPVGIVRQSLRPAINDDGLPVYAGGDAASQKPSIIRLVIQNLPVAFRVVANVCISCIEEAAVGVNPEHKIRILVRQLVDCLASPSNAFLEEVKLSSRFDPAY